MSKKSVEPTIVKGIPNIHPADELAAIREEIKQMQERAEELRDVIILMSDSDDPDTNLKGDMYTACIIPGMRETLDRKALVEAYGEKAIAPFIKKTAYQTVKLVEN
jgi:hypothetical protein